ncbi:bifunctional metallophosphatase/5'-nucleotidase [Salsuginibacillus kocurii]|uniref:bifunctional metallophosphatase/5'-nucleotidase n=1 Tax=Salsuginibacillus kocurii TaxID=427078 RepID=UPI00037484D6|nr:bifunctional UDP-sugar hydrolase/5'-nucleotidase [Salsuginibacillus kocurii]
MSLYPVYIYHSNDLHSYLEQWPKVASYFKEREHVHRERHEDALFFDIGDHADRVHPVTEGTAGKSNVQLLNATPVHHVTIGNNEGITFSREDLDALYEEANFQVLVANLFDQSGMRPTWSKPYDRIELPESKLTVGVTAVTAPFTPFYTKLGWHIVEPTNVLPDILTTLKQTCDVTILLSHLGYPQDEMLAARFSELDVILGAHTHHLLKTAQEVDGTLIAQAGKHSFYAGQVRLLIDTNTKEIVNKEGGTVSMKTFKEDETTKQILQEQEQQADTLLMEKITTLDQPLAVDWENPSPLADVLVDAVREWCETDFAMINAGLLLDSLASGPVTRMDIHRICPHPVNPCILTVSGAVLKESIHAAFTKRMIHFELKGFGFRGEKLGRMAFSGIEVQIVHADDDSERVADITMQGEPLLSNKMYTLATADMFTFGYLYPGFAQAEQKEYLMPEMMRDILANKLMKMSDGEGK